MLCLASFATTAFLVPAPAPTTQPRAMVSMAKGNDAVSFGELDGSEMRIGIIKARWHKEVIDDLVDGAKTALMETGVKEENIFVTEVPGSFELPLASRFLAASGTVDAIIPMGVLVKGDTYHFEVIADSVARGLMNVGIQTTIPIIFGVLTVNTDEQAKERSTGSNNHGSQWGKAAVEMALLRSSALGRKGKKNFLGFGQADDAASSDSEVDLGGKKIGF